MLPEIAFIDKAHLLLIIAVLVGAVAGMKFEQFLSKLRRQAWRERNRWRWERKHGGGNLANGPWLAKPDPAVQKNPMPPASYGS